MRSERLSARVPAIAAALAAVAALASVAGFFVSRQSLHDRDQRTFVRRAAAVAARFEAQVAGIVDAAERTASAAARAAADDDATPDDVADATATLATLPGVATVDLVASIPPSPVADAALLARDAGDARVTQPTESGDPVLVVATYEREATSVAERRTLHNGYLVVTLDTAAVLRDILAGPIAPTFAVTVTSDGKMFASIGRASRGAEVRTSTFSVGGQAWTVRTAPTGRFADGALLPWGVLVAGLVIAAGAAVSALAVRRVVRGAISEHEARASELALIADGGSLLHQSLDLGDVLPAFAVRLADDLALDRVGILVLDDDGNLREIFAVGGTTRTPLSTLPVGPTSAAAGEDFLLRLQRSGRNIGALRLRARNEVTPTRMRALVALADLLASTLGNIQLYADEQETVRRLQELDRLKNDFVGTVSHELRTTVTAIAGFADLLVQQWDALPEATRRDFLRRVSRNAGSLRLLVDDMLDVTRIDRLALSVSPEPIDLSAAVTAVTEQMTTILEHHGLDVAVPPGVHAWADTRAVERILTNLLSNAAKYSPAGTTVHVTLTVDADHAVLTVDDEGPGVPADERERIFARFYRGESEGARRTRGAGVGLAIVRELVDRLSATVNVDTAPGGGARFEIRFPLRQPEVPLVPASQRGRT